MRALYAVGATLGLGVIALAIALGLGSDRDRAVDAVQLPKPEAPLISALLAPQATGIGWTWVNPRPSAMPTFYGVDVQSKGRALMVGAGGAVVEYDGRGLLDVTTDTVRDLRAVAYLDDDRAIAAGDGGTLLLVERGKARVIASPVPHDLRAVVRISADAAVVVGNEGTALRVTAEGVAELPSESEAHLVSAAHHNDAIWVGDAAGRLLRLSEEGLVVDSQPADGAIFGIAGCPGRELYLAADTGAVLRRVEEGFRAIPIDEPESISGLACDEGRVIAVTRRGGVLLFSGDRKVQLPTNTDRALHSVASVKGAGTWVVGEAGRLLMVEHSRVRFRTAGPTAPIRDAATLGGALIAVGEYGRIFRERDSRLVLGKSPTKSGLSAVAPSAPDALVAVGDFGALVEITWDGAKLLGSPTDRSLRDVVAANGRILAVGVDGVVVRGELGNLEATRLKDTPSLWSVTGTPEDAIAVGEAGVIVRLGAEGTTRIPCEEDVRLRAVVRLDDATWAVGDGGLVLRVDGSCQVEHRGGPDLYGIGAGPRGAPVAVGDGGATLERSADGTWAKTTLDVNGVDLRNVLATNRDVYVVGERGVIVRHIRLD